MATKKKKKGGNSLGNLEKKRFSLLMIPVGWVKDRLAPRYFLMPLPRDYGFLGCLAALDSRPFVNKYIADAIYMLGNRYLNYLAGFAQELDWPDAPLNFV